MKTLANTPAYLVVELAIYTFAAIAIQTFVMFVK
jgi:hypothetical protein